MTRRTVGKAGAAGKDSAVSEAAARGNGAAVRPSGAAGKAGPARAVGGLREASTASRAEATIQASPGRTAGAVRDDAALREAPAAAKAGPAGRTSPLGRAGAMGKAGLAGLLALSVLSIFVGVIDMSLTDLWTDPDALRLILLSRLPRTLAVIITGAALAVAGAIMQMLVQNRFVEPMTAGTGQGAALGILLAVLLVPGAPILVKMILASATALATSLGFFAIVRRLPPTQPLLVPLVGIVYGGIIGAGVTFVAYQADLLQYIDVWMNGEFSGVLRGRYELLWGAAAVAGLAYLVADQFAIAGLGRDVSVNLGLNYRQVMLAGLVAISAVTALTVVTVGMIPFVGLVVPNIISRRYGDNLRATLPLTALMGAGLVLLSDILGRTLRAPFEIPVGTVFGVIGAVVFLWLLYARPTRHAG